MDTILSHAHQCNKTRLAAIVQNKTMGHLPITAVAHSTKDALRFFECACYKTLPSCYAVVSNRRRTSLQT
jgi:hypothetical protein